MVARKRGPKKSQGLRPLRPLAEQPEAEVETALVVGA